jgi:hypothetical protein
MAYISIISELLDNQQYDSMYEFIQFLVLKEDLKPELATLFSSFLQQVQTQHESTSKTLHRCNLYTALLAADPEDAQLLKYYHSLEDGVLIQQRRTMEKEKRVCEALLVKENSQLDWNLFFHFIMANQIHFVEYIIQLCLDFADHKRLDQVALLVKPFQPLKPLIFLLLWDRHKGEMISDTSFIPSFWTVDDNMVDSLPFYSNVERVLALIFHSITLVVICCLL